MVFHTLIRIGGIPLNKRPNILYLHAHDAGRFISPFGYPFETPALQGLAERGTLFRRAFSAAPACSPSRAALLTGSYPHCCGMYGLATDWSGFALKDHRRHLAGFLAAQGYETALAGVQHVSREPWSSPETLGYEHLLNSEGSAGHDPRRTTAAALDFIHRRHEAPFFLSVGFVEPHRYNEGDRNTFSRFIPAEPENLDSRYAMPLPGYPDGEPARRETANFAQGVSLMDREMGTVLQALSKAGLEEDTLVICTTDHGPGMPGMKTTLSDLGTGVFLILAGPGIPEGAVEDGLVQQMDLFPTLCDLLDLPRPDWLQGKSIRGLLEGREAAVHREIFTEQTYHERYLPLRAVRTERYKLILRYGPGRPRGDYSADDGGPLDRFWKENGWAGEEVPERQLFDLYTDPQEKHNLAEDPAFREIREDLSARLENHLRDTEDAVALGEPVLPPGLSGSGWIGDREVPESLVRRSRAAENA